MLAFNDLSSSHWGLMYLGRTRWYYTSIWPNRVEDTQGLFSHGAENKGWTKHFEKKKKILKKSEDNWIFTLNSSTKITNKKKINSWMLCWFFVLTLSYSTTVSWQKNAHGFFVQMNIWNSTRGWMQYDIWCLHCVDLMHGWTEGSPAFKEVRLVSKCGDRKNSVRRKHKIRAKSGETKDRKAMAMLSLYQSGVCVIFLDSSCSISEVRLKWGRGRPHSVYYSDGDRVGGRAWACSAGWEEVSSAEGSNYSWGEENRCRWWGSMVDDGRGREDMQHKARGNTGCRGSLTTHSAPPGCSAL